MWLCDLSSILPHFIFSFLIVEAATRNQFNLSSESTQCSHGTRTFLAAWWMRSCLQSAHSFKAVSTYVMDNRPFVNKVIFSPGLLISHQNKLSQCPQCPMQYTPFNVIYISCNYPQVRSSCLSYSTSIRRSGMCVTELAGSTSLRFSESAQCSAHPHVTMAASS